MTDTQPQRPALLSREEIDAMARSKLVHRRTDIPYFRTFARAIEAAVHDKLGEPAIEVTDAAELLVKYKNLCVEFRRGDSYHLARIDRAVLALTRSCTATTLASHARCAATQP